MEQMEPEDMGGLDLTPENVDTVLDEIRWDAWMQPWHCHPSPCSFLYPEVRTTRLSGCSLVSPPPLPVDRPYLIGTGGGGLDLVEIDGPIAKVRITGPAASVMTVRVAVTQKLRERIPGIAAVQLVN